MDTPEELARRLLVSLEPLTDRSRDISNVAAAQNFAAAAEQVNQQLQVIPDDLQYLLQTAESGFPASGDWVDKAIADRKETVGKLARSARIVADWHGEEGIHIERMFLIRGNIRGWAHRWRTAGRGSAQVDDDPAFVEFAAECLARAGIDTQPGDVIAKALRSDWRTAPL